MNERAPDVQAATPGEVFWYTSAVTAAVLVMTFTAPYYRCSPVHGLLALLLITMFAPYVMLPALAIPGAIALLVVRLRGRTGSRRVWQRVLAVTLGLLLLSLAAATVASIGAPSNSCDLS